MNDTNFSSLTASRSVLPSFFGPDFPYAGPKELIAASELSIGEKREILSSWASDGRAVPDAPALRVLDNGQAVTIHDILEALKMLDAAGLETDNLRLKEFRPRSKGNSSRRWLPTILRRHRRDDDDDPPPCPAVIAPLPRLPSSGAENALEAA
jgi:hypothetical protein